MGLLDDLKKEAEQKQEQGRQRDAEAAAQQAFYDEHLRPAMQQAYRFLEELASTLNAVNREVPVPYRLDPAEKRRLDMKHGHYVFKGDDYERPQKLILFCDCALEERTEFYVSGRTAVSRYAALLDGHKIPHHAKNELDQAHEVANAHFTLEGPMRVQIRLLASAEDRCIYVDLLNLEAQPTKRYKLAPEKVDEALLDRLARLLIREESILVEVKISDDTRAELRRKLEQEKRRLAEEQARADAAAEAERLAEEEAKLINRAKRSVADGLKKILPKD